MKNLILIIGLLVSGIANAQYIIWEEEFDGVAQTQPWSFYSFDDNPYTWNLSQNMELGSSGGQLGNLDILNYKNLDMTGNIVVFAPQDDWAVSPMIDLTGASGTITLAINYQDDVISNVGILPVYISTDADIQVIKNSQPFGELYFSKPPMTVQFTEKTLDISEFAGQQIYIAFGKQADASDSSTDHNSEIDYVNILSDTPAATEEFKVNESQSRILGNPAQNTLTVALSPEFLASRTACTVYNMAGQKVLSAPYAETTDISTLHSGMYLLELTDGNRTERLKFIKK